MKKVLIVLANLVLPGSAQVALGRPGWGVLAASVFGVSVAAVAVGWGLAPGLLSGQTGVGLLAAAAAAWVASQVSMARRLAGRDEGQERVHRAQALQEVARLWLRGERERSLAVTEALLERWPTEPALHFLAAHLWSAGPDGASAKQARRFLTLCGRCDLTGRWHGVVRRELERLRSELEPHLVPGPLELVLFQEGEEKARVQQSSF